MGQKVIIQERSDVVPLILKSVDHRGERERCSSCLDIGQIRELV